MKTTALPVACGMGADLGRTQKNGRNNTAGDWSQTENTKTKRRRTGLAEQERCQEETNEEKKHIINLR